MAYRNPLSAFITAFDSFAKPITLTHNSKDAYKTCCGGLASLLIYALMTAYLYLLLTQPLESSFSIITNTITQEVTNGTDDSASNVSDINQTDNGEDNSTDLGNSSADDENDTQTEEQNDTQIEENDTHIEDENNTDPDTNDTSSETNNTGSETSDTGTDPTYIELEFTETYTERKTTYDLDTPYSTYHFFPNADGFQFAAAMLSGGDAGSLYLEFYAFMNTYDEGFQYKYLPAVQCTEDMFPAMLSVQLHNFGILTAFLCPDLSEVPMISDEYAGAEFSMVEVNIVKCQGSSCYPEETMEQMHKGDMLFTAWSEGFYDPDDYDNPVKHRLNMRHPMPVSAVEMNQRYIRIRPNVVETLAAEHTVFYDVAPEATIPVGYCDAYCNIDTFTLGLNYDYYKQYIDYQPDFEALRRSLQNKRRSLSSESTQEVTSDKEELVSTEYMVFYIFAQLGGLYSFVVLFLRIFVDHVTQKAYDQEMVNDCYMRNLNLSQSRNESSHNSKILPESGTPPIQFHPNRSIHNEDIPLIDSPAFNPIAGSRATKLKPNATAVDRNEVYDGGSQVEILSRSRLKNMTDSSGPVYNNNDLMYSIFCCKRGSADNRSRSGRHCLLQSDTSSLKQKQDLVHILWTLDYLKSKYLDLDSRLTSEPSSGTPALKPPSNAPPIPQTEEEAIPKLSRNSRHIQLQNHTMTSNGNNLCSIEPKSNAYYKEEVKSIHRILNDELDPGSNSYSLNRPYNNNNDDSSFSKGGGIDGPIQEQYSKEDID